MIHRAADMAREQGADLSLIELRDFPMPLYDGDLLHDRPALSESAPARDNGSSCVRSRIATSGSPLYDELRKLAAAKLVHFLQQRRHLIAGAAVRIGEHQQRPPAAQVGRGQLASLNPRQPELGRQGAGLKAVTLQPAVGQFSM